MIVIAAVAVCALSTPIQDCDQRTAKNIIFTPYVYNEHMMPYVCYRESMAFVVSEQKIGRQQYARVYCGPYDDIQNRFGMI